MTMQLPPGYVWAEDLVDLWQRRVFPDHVNPLECLVIEMSRPDDWICLSEGAKWEQKRKFLIDTYGVEHFHFEDTTTVSRYRRIFVPQDGLYAFFEVYNTEQAFAQLETTKYWLDTVCGWSQERYKTQFITEITLGKRDKKDPAFIKDLLRGLRIQNCDRHLDRMPTTWNMAPPPVPPSTTRPAQSTRRRQQPEAAQLHGEQSTPQHLRLHRPHSAGGFPMTKIQALQSLFDPARYPEEQEQIEVYHGQLHKLGLHVMSEMGEVTAKMLMVEVNTVLLTDYLAEEMCKNIALLFGVVCPTSRESAVLKVRAIMTSHLHEQVIPFSAQFLPQSMLHLDNKNTRFQVRRWLLTFPWMSANLVGWMFNEYTNHTDSPFFGWAHEKFRHNFLQTKKLMDQNQLDPLKVADDRTAHAVKMFARGAFGDNAQFWYYPCPSFQALYSWHTVKWDNLPHLTLRVTRDVVYKIKDYEVSRLRTVEQQITHTRPDATIPNAADELHPPAINSHAKSIISTLNRGKDVSPVEESEPFVVHLPTPLPRTSEASAMTTSPTGETYAHEARTNSRRHMRTTRLTAQTSLPSETPGADIFTLQKQISETYGEQLGIIFAAHTTVLRASLGFSNYLRPDPQKIIGELRRLAQECSGEGPPAKKARVETEEDSEDSFGSAEAAEALMSLLDSK